MGLYKIFKDEFFDMMKSHGFIHQGNVFFRVLNGEILQAVTVKPIVNYDITMTVFPLFSPNSTFSSIKFASRTKPCWAEAYMLSFNGFADFPHKNEIYSGKERRLSYSLYPYLKKMEAETVENIRKASEVFEKIYIPQLDKISDFESYINWMLLGTKERQIFNDYYLTDADLVYRSYIDGSFEWGREYIAEQRQKYFERELRLINEYLESSFEEELFRETGIRIPKRVIDPQKKLDDTMKEFDEKQNNRYCKFYEAERSNDLSWVPEYVKSEKDKTLESLKSMYSKLTI